MKNSECKTYIDEVILFKLFLMCGEKSWKKNELNVQEAFLW